MFRLEDEQSDDVSEGEALLDLAFGMVRSGLSAYRLREGVEPVRELCIAARDEFGSLAGLVRFWPVLVGAPGHDALLLGPIAVHPTRQGEGLGSLLIIEGLARARKRGWQHALLVGDQPYYARFGFAKCEALEFPPPTDPDRVLGLDLLNGGVPDLRGAVRKWKPPGECPGLRG